MSESSEALSRATTAQPLVADDLISEVVRGIAGLQRHRGLQLACEIGHLIVEKFYGGDASVLRDRGPKDASLRKLAEHPDLPMSPSALFRAVAIYEVAERTGGVATWKHLGPSHVRAVLALPPADQERLLQHADHEGWTVLRIEQEVSQARAQSKQGGGRPPLPRFQKSIHALAKYAEGDGEVFGDLHCVHELDPDEARRLYQTVTALKLKCEELQVKLQPRVPGIGDGE